jgi:hypothetical protein
VGERQQQRDKGHLNFKGVPASSFLQCVVVSSKALVLSASLLLRALMSARAGWEMCRVATMLLRAKSCLSFGRTTRQASVRST